MPVEESKRTEQEFLKVNQYLRMRHQDHIEAFVSRTGWEMQTSSTGLWYNITPSNSDKQVLLDSRISYSFSSMLLDGTPCYSNPSKAIVVGKGGIESGVEEGLLLMEEGDSATLIIPPHLGHGNFGDRKKIPGNSVLIYQLRVLKVNDLP